MPAKKAKRQTGTNRKGRSIKRDKKIKAKHPGPRTSSSGRKYSERRANRSDKNRTKKL